MYISPLTVNQLTSCSGVDFTPPATAGRVFDKRTPVIVILHGITGGTLVKHWSVASKAQWFLIYATIGSHTEYVRNIVAPAVATAEEGGLGYRAVVVNFRGCT